MANKLNMTIAKTHQLSSRVVGMQLTSGNFVGLVLSAMQMVIGFIYLAGNGAWYMTVLIAVIGVALAVLVERLTLGGLIAIRVSNERINRLEENHFQTLQTEQREETQAERINLDRRLTKLKRDKKMSIPVAVVGMLLSTSIGDIFWHHLFESLGGFLAFALSFSCAGVIGLTFVYSELYKAIMDGTLGEIIDDQILMKKAVGAEEQNMQLGMMVDGYDSIRKDGGRLEPAKIKVEETLVSRLSNFADAVASAGTIANGIESLDGQTKIELLNSGEATKRLDAPASERTNTRGQFDANRDKLKQLLIINPNISMVALGKLLDIAPSTAHAWVKKLNA